MNIFVLNTIGVGLNTLNLIQDKLSLAGVIGLSPTEKNRSLSDYVDQTAYCSERGLTFTGVDSYELTTLADKNRLLSLKIDVLVVVGWQRLIPDWLIEHCNYCAIGAHGSPLGITKGRGRSPQNWALILGLEQFEISIFEIDPGVDAGRVIATRSFQYSQHDDIKTSYYKTSLMIAEMVVDVLQSSEFTRLDFEAQQHDQAEYFPQRQAQDGAIDWRRSNTEITRFIRALTKPYPGAFTTLDDSVVTIWVAIPFDIDLQVNSEPGTIITVFGDNDLLVKSGSGYVLVTDYDCYDKSQCRTKSVFNSVSYNQQLQEIVTRHKEKNPKFQVVECIIKQLNDR